MAKTQPLRLLILGYDQTKITFLNRLIRGLIDQDIQVILATTQPEQIEAQFQGALQTLKLVPLKNNLFIQVFRFLTLLISALFSKKRQWLWQLVLEQPDLKQRLGMFFRYAPFCQSDFNLIYFPWNSSAITYQKLFDLGLPIVISCRGSQINIRPNLPGQEVYLTGVQETLQKAAAVHCVSADIQREAQKYGLPPKKSVIIRPAVDPNTFKPAMSPPQNNRLQIVTTGSLIWRKGYEYLLMAFQMLIQEKIEAELHIIGGGYMEQALRFTMQDLGLEGLVHLHGHLQPAQVLAKLQQSDIFVLSSLSEGLSNAVLEAMSCGLPVVTTDCGGMAEAVTDGVAGFLVPLRDPQAMGTALIKLAQNPNLRLRMGAAGRARILKDFKLEDQISAFTALFKRAMDRL
jgi:colanic acid/amylovoran biosynthesis glycosyltransferase